MHIVEAPGGVERYLVTLLNKFKPYSEFEHVLVCSNSLDVSKFHQLVKQIIVVESMHNPISFINDTKSILYIRNAIKQIKPDIVYCHSSKAGAIGRVANLGIKNRLFYNAHGWSFNIKGERKIKILFYEVVERILSSITDKIICISEFEKKSALEHKICKEDKLVVINNGIDFDEYKSLTPKSKSDLGIPVDAFVIGMIGRLTTQKAPDVFVDMAYEVKKKIPEAFFVIVGDDIGDGHFRGDVEECINKIGLSDSFLITGWVDNPLDYASCFDVAVLLSRWEGFGLVLAEYMMLQKPIVTTKVDAIPFVVGDAGLLVELDDYMKAAESVISLYKNKVFLNYLIEKEKERVQLFNVQRTVNEHIELFMKC